MKKNIIAKISSFVCIVIIALSQTACSLEEENPSGMSTDKEWTTPEGFNKLLVSCYLPLVRLVYGQAEDTYIFESESGTDIWQDPVNGGSNGNFSKCIRYMDMGPSVYMFYEAYQGFYAVLNNANAVIAYADKVQGMEAEKVKELKAEAHFLRAHSLFNIVEYYGGKYLPTTPTTEAMTSLPCSSINDFYKVILADLETAMNDLPIKQAVTGRVIRAAAYHLYAKACLTYASYTDGKCGATPISTAEAKELWQKALAATDYLIDNASTLGVKLYPEIESVFDENNNKSNAEALFVVTHSSVMEYNPRQAYFNRAWKQFEAYNNNNEGICMECLTPDYSNVLNGYTITPIANGSCRLCPSKKFLDLFKDNDRRYKAFFRDTYYANRRKLKATSGPFKGQQVYAWTENDAKRYGLDLARVNNPEFYIPLNDTCVYISKKKLTEADRNSRRYATYNIDDNYVDQTQPKRFFPSMSKFNTPKYYAGSNASKPYSYADCIIYRLGETYLLAAEAAWRLGQTDKALERINAIRKRACSSDFDHFKITADNLNQETLLNEYALEMCGEWCRWQTLKRFRALAERIKEYNPQITTFIDEYYLRPINASETDALDNGSDYQNPGY